MYEYKARRFQLIEVKCTNTQNNAQFSFQQQPLLQSITGGQRVFVQAIRAYSSNAVGGSPFTQGNVMPTAADIQNTTLTLSVLGTFRVRNLPLAELNAIWSDSAAYVPFTLSSFLLCNFWGIDWTQCFITCVLGAHAANVSFLFGIYYCYSTDPQADLLGVDPDQSQIPM
jgi:hypothetical protein